jgi:exodeoxyribonuclease V alpha subunit
VLIAGALLAQLEGQGHSCLPLDALLADPHDVLGWPAPATAALQRLLAAWPAEQWSETLRASPLVTDCDGDGDGDGMGGGGGLIADANARPLVWQAGRLYLRRYWRHERRLAAQVLQRCQRHDAVDPALLRSALRQLFDERPSPAGIAAAASIEPIEPIGSESAESIDWQQVACAIALRGRLTIVTGGPGTGKTYTAARLLMLLSMVEPAALRDALAAPTGKAAARLRTSIEAALQAVPAGSAAASTAQRLLSQLGPARTLHALLGARPDTR